MLCQFSFKNFKSYKEATTFDFQATSIPEFSDSLLSGNKGQMGRSQDMVPQHWKGSGRERAWGIRVRTPRAFSQESSRAGSQCAGSPFWR